MYTYVVGGRDSEVKVRFHMCGERTLHETRSYVLTLEAAKEQQGSLEG
jgi:hypothetical protein